VAKLVFVAITSLDGFHTDEDGKFDWSSPDPEVHAFINDLERRFGTHLYGRKMYETMAWWETFDGSGDPRPEGREYATIWRAADKVVYSTTLADVSSARTRIERTFDPTAVRLMKDGAARDLSIGGPNLAGQAIAAGLVDELHLFVQPVTVGGGTPALPARNRSAFQLLATDRFSGGTVHLHYRFGG
jgi:dihydrofolate reductase